MDECVGKVVEATSKMGGISLITADHGNAEHMVDADGCLLYTSLEEYRTTSPRSERKSSTVVSTS